VEETVISGGRRLTETPDRILERISAKLSVSISVNLLARLENIR
jgi:hypothetical protein